MYNIATISETHFKYMQVNSQVVKAPCDCILSTMGILYFIFVEKNSALNNIIKKTKAIPRESYDEIILYGILESNKPPYFFFIGKQNNN